MKPLYETFRQDGLNADLCRREAVMNGKQVVIVGSVGGVYFYCRSLYIEPNFTRF